MGRTLCLENVSIGYDKKVVASGITASLEPGELVCLLGRNGIGKSTLLRTIAGFQPKLSGKITIGDKTLETFERKELARTIGIVLTDRTDLQEMTVEELVSLGRSPYTGFFGNLSAEDKEKVEGALSLVGITELRNRRVMTLSDGERQKAMIAKTLAQQTHVILLDEPTAFLDFQSRIELFALLKKLAREEKKTILMTTHDVHLALRFADVVWLFGKDEKGETNLAIHPTPLPQNVVADFVGFKNADLIL